jgi:hypothetical protein
MEEQVKTLVIPVPEAANAAATRTTEPIENRSLKASVPT